MKEQKSKRPRGQGQLYTRKGSAFVWFRYHVQGREYRESSQTTDWKIAKRKLEQRIKERGADEIGAKPFIGPEEERITVGELLDDLVLHLEAGNKKGKPFTPLSRLKFLSHVKPVRAAFGDGFAVKLTSSTINRVKKEWTEKKLADGTIKRMADGTVNRRLSILRQALLLALKPGNKRLNSMPCTIELKTLHNTRQGFFERHQVETLIKNLPEYLQDLTRFAYFTAWRKGEVTSLEWTDVDLQAKFIRLRGENSKNGKSRKVALVGDLWEIIQRRLVAKDIITHTGIKASRFVFHRNGCPVGDFRKAWATACKAAKVGGKLFHDLRRSGIRNLVRAGVDKTTAKEISGHKTDSVFERYDIKDDEDLKKAAAMVDAYVKKLPTEIETAQKPHNQE